MSPTTDILTHVVIVAAEVSALVVPYGLAKKHNVAPTPEIKSA